jgi:CubicO group peptidase (beta-lactamase class C family)
MTRMIRAFVAILLLGTLLASVGLTQSSGARMDEVVQTFLPTQFMGSVLVAKGDQVLLSKGYGLANVEAGVPNNATTKFRLASITKQFTAAAILILEEHGKLKVEDTIKTHLPDAPATWDNVTLFHLLTHTSGIPSAIGVPGDPKEQPLTPVESVALVRGKPLLFAPGQGWSYSNSGYAILGYLIERISGQSYEQFLQENIFTPLGMKDSGYDSNSPSVQNRATGYSASRSGGPPAKAPFVDMSRPYAAGALYSTVEDLLRWEQGLFGGRLLSKASLDKMTKPFRNNYAFGLQVRTLNGHKVIDHSGGIQGFNTMLAYYPDEKVTVAALGNLSGSAPAQIANLMGRLAHGETFTLLSERREVSLDPQLLSQFAGTYQLSGSSTMVITADTNQLYSKIANQDLMSLFSESETKFFARTRNVLVEFSGNDAAGRPTQLILSQDGKNTTAQRLSDAEAKRLADAEAGLAQRIREKKPHPQSEAALRRIIEELRKGQPNYGLMTAAMAETLRRQLTLLQTIVNRGGAVQTIVLTAVTPNGTDLYSVKVANESWECRVLIGPDNKVDTFAIRVLKD